MRPRWIGAALLVSVLGSSSASADPEGWARAADAGAPRHAPLRVALGFQPFLLDGPEIALGSEVRLTDRVTVLMTTAFGQRARRPAATPSGFLTAEPRLYPFGHPFAGPHVGGAFAFARALSGPVASLFEPPLGWSTGPTAGWTLPLRVVDVAFFLDADTGLLFTLAAPSQGDGGRIHFLGRFSIGVAF